MNAPWDRGTEASGYSGPWSDLPPAEPVAREPLLRRGGGGAPRERWIKNWRALAVIAFLLFVAPPLAGWLGRVIMGMVAAH